MSRKRILFVDEQLETAQLLASKCRAIGLDVDTAHDAVTAVTLLKQRKPDLVCVDAELPGGDGLRLSEMVLRSPDDVPCPVIILTHGREKPAEAPAAEMCVYYVRRRPDLWRYLGPVIYELVDVAAVGGSANDEEHDVTQCAS